MMFGWDIQKGFISVLALSYLMVIASISGVQMMILTNRMEFYTSLVEMNKQVYFEVLIMERIKDSYLQKLVDDCSVNYENMVAELDFEGNIVMVEYDFDEVSYKRKYVYNEEFSFLEIIAL